MSSSPRPVVRVSLYPLRAFVPAHYFAVRVEHEDGVVLDALNEQAEALLALPQSLLGSASFAQVPGYFGETRNLSTVIPDIADHDLCLKTRTVSATPPSL